MNSDHDSSPRISGQEELRGMLNVFFLDVIDLKTLCEESRPFSSLAMARNDLLDSILRLLDSASDLVGARGDELGYSLPDVDALLSRDGPPTLDLKGNCVGSLYMAFSSFERRAGDAARRSLHLGDPVTTEVLNGVVRAVSTAVNLIESYAKHQTLIGPPRTSGNHTGHEKSSPALRSSDPASTSIDEMK